MRTRFISTLLAFLVFSIAIQAQFKFEEPDFNLSAAGQTVLLGTYIWDADADAFPASERLSGKTGDIWWRQERLDKQSLVPLGNTLIIEVRDRDFAGLTVEDLKVLRYSPKPIANDRIVPGAIIALRTSEGNYAKLRVVGYRPLHDFSFKEAVVLDACWKTFVLKKSNKENYHLEVEWVLYTKQ